MSKIVFVVDDDTVLRMAYATAMHKLGFQVETFPDGLEAQQGLKKVKPDLIVLDMLMPNLDGLGFLKELRRNEEQKDIKVIVVSNFESMPEAADYDIVTYLTKQKHTPEQLSVRVAKELQAS